MTEKLYPNADIDEVIANAKKSSVGKFFKQYVKGDWSYQTEKRPFNQRNTIAVHVPTKTVFFYNPMFMSWDIQNKKFYEY